MDGFLRVLLLPIVLPIYAPCYLLDKVLLFFKIVYFIPFKIIGSLFYVTNYFQRVLAKPWLFMLKSNWRSEGAKRIWIGIFNFLKIPLYILLAPLRLLNALYYNVLGHAPFMTFDLIQTILVTDDINHNGESFNYKNTKSMLKYVFLFPIRLIRNILWELPITWLESLVWTIIDTFVPALTLYHGTSLTKGINIVSSRSRALLSDYRTGMWFVGDGNFAGDGIYFAPDLSTAQYYSRREADNCVVYCRVTLGKVMDLGLSPRYIYNYCAKPNAHEVSRFGVMHGFVSGEWWRPNPPKDKGHKGWEYTLYQKDGVYRDSWRIRPLFLYNDSIYFKRIPGGIAHWF